MATRRTVPEITSAVEDELVGAGYGCTSLSILSGGTANFVLRGVLTNPLPDGTQEVLVKHGENYVAHHPNFPLPTSRCHVEAECLQLLAAFPACTTPSCVVRTPRLYQFNEATNTQVQEYLREALDLKSFALKHYTAPTDPAVKPKCLELGRGLGAWLRAFHDWVRLPEQVRLADLIRLQGGPMQRLKYQINYERLIQTIDRFPSLEDARRTFEDVRNMALAEIEPERSLHVIHGDFWTGNILLPDAPLVENSQTPVFVADWEMCQLGVPALDLGQMVAELYELFLFKDIQAGLWLIDGFAAGYGPVGDDVAFRTAIHTGTHLICWGSGVRGWGDAEQVQRVVDTGKALILRAWEKDRAYFEGGHLAALFERRPS